MYVFLLLGLVATAFASDSGCTSKGGTCQDYRYNVCRARYEQGLCDGDENRRCCNDCDYGCQTTESRYSRNDGACIRSGGKCMHNSNYCTGTYVTGKCGGLAARQCCSNGGGTTYAGDFGCTSKGGTCQDYRYNVCIAKYEQGLCSGDENRRCCNDCDSVCLVTESGYAQNDGACTSSGGKCMHNSNYCAGNYASGKCGGPAERQCCSNGGGSSGNCYGNINNVDTTGASQATANQDNLVFSGVRASEKMAEEDKGRMAQYKSLIEQAAATKCMDPSIIAGIISRETRAGGALQSNGYGYDNHGYGLMQVDDRYHTLQGGPYSLEHILQGTQILIDMINGVKSKHPSWTQDMALKGGISAYNAGVGNVDSYENMDVGTTGNDYANDVVARSQWYKANGY